MRFDDGTNQSVRLHEAPRDRIGERGVERDGHTEADVPDVERVNLESEGLARRISRHEDQCRIARHEVFDDDFRLAVPGTRRQSPAAVLGRHRNAKSIRAYQIDMTAHDGQEADLHRESFNFNEGWQVRAVRDPESEPRPAYARPWPQPDVDGVDRRVETEVFGEAVFNDGGDMGRPQQPGGHAEEHQASDKRRQQPPSHPSF